MSVFDLDVPDPAFQIIPDQYLAPDPILKVGVAPIFSTYMWREIIPGFGTRL
jgi:hypothetical protein